MFLSCPQKLWDCHSGSGVGHAHPDRHECRFYDALNSWWHQNGNVNAYVNEIEEV